MGVKIKSALGSVTLDAENIASNTTVTVPAGGGTLATAARVNAVGGRKNLIMNGGMQVAQRGTSAVGGSTGLHYGGTDRYRVYQENTAAAYTLSQDSNSPNGFGSSLKVDVTTADATADAADRVDLLYRFEGNELQGIAKGTSDAKQLSLSFWVSSPKTGTHIVELYDSDNSRQVSASYTVNTADTWEKKTITFPADTTGAFTNDANLSLQVAWWLLAGSNFTSGTLNTSWAANTNANRAVGQVNVVDNTANNFYLTGIQLELGDTATDFEHRSFGEELALCKRYYQAFTTSFSADSTTSFLFNLQFPVTMRTSPSVSYSYGGVDGDVYKNSDATTPSFSSPNGLFTNSNGITTGYKFGTSFTKGDTYTTNWVMDAEL